MAFLTAAIKRLSPFATVKGSVGGILDLVQDDFLAESCFVDTEGTRVGVNAWITRHPALTHITAMLTWKLALPKAEKSLSLAFI